MIGNRRYFLRFPRFTAMVKCGVPCPDWWISPLAKDATRKVKAEAPANASVRATISFPTDLYETLQELARGKKVSLAWVVRDAAEQYVRDKWPLFVGRS